MKYLSILTLPILAFSGCDCADKTPVNGDASAINQHGKSGSSKTPLGLKENQKYIDITAIIRRQLVDARISINAQNISIVTQDGMVTLRGPVSTDDEKRQIETMARKVAGETNVDNQLAVVKSN